MKLSMDGTRGRAICGSGPGRAKKDVPGERVFARSSLAFMVVNEETVRCFKRNSEIRVGDDGGWRARRRERVAALDEQGQGNEVATPGVSFSARPASLSQHRLPSSVQHLHKAGRSFFCFLSLELIKHPFDRRFRLGRYSLTTTLHPSASPHIPRRNNGR